MINAVIVDDEKTGIENLKYLIAEYCKKITVAGEATNIDEAAKLISELKPDVVFLDIQLSNKTSFELIKHMPHHTLIVFVTAYPNYALKAIKSNAFDYILKPIDIDELVLCEEKIAEELDRRSANSSSPELSGKIKLSDKRGIYIIDINEIIYLRAESNYATIYLMSGTAERKIVITKTLLEFERILPADKFFRVHKSYIVNVDKILNYSNENNSSVQLINGVKIDIARRKITSFLSFIKKHYSG